MGLFLGLGWDPKFFWALCIQTNNFCFISIVLFLFFHEVCVCGGGQVVGKWDGFIVIAVSLPTF